MIGDSGPGIYVQPAIPALLRDRLLPQADIATPNQFELEHLTGQHVPHACAMRWQAAQALRATMRPGACVLVTSLACRDTPHDASTCSRPRTAAPGGCARR